MIYPIIKIKKHVVLVMVQGQIYKESVHLLLLKSIRLILLQYHWIKEKALLMVEKVVLLGHF